MNVGDARTSRRESKRQRRPETLPPRLRRTLERLLAGESEKTAARAMGISHHTVHEYVKQIYKHFGVNSRGELMAKWVKGMTGGG